jgi:hypothetical protein
MKRAQTGWLLLAGLLLSGRGSISAVAQSQFPDLPADHPATMSMFRLVASATVHGHLRRSARTSEPRSRQTFVVPSAGWLLSPRL